MSAQVGAQIFIAVIDALGAMPALVCSQRRYRCSPHCLNWPMGSPRKPWSTDCPLFQTARYLCKARRSGLVQSWTAAISLPSAVGISVPIVSHETRKRGAVLRQSSKLLRGLVFCVTSSPPRHHCRDYQGRCVGDKSHDRRAGVLWLRCGERILRYHKARRGGRALCRNRPLTIDRASSNINNVGRHWGNSWGGDRATLACGDCGDSCQFLPRQSKNPSRSAYKQEARQQIASAARRFKNRNRDPQRRSPQNAGSDNLIGR
jgi:hypothetical protein